MDQLPAKVDSEDVAVDGFYSFNLDDYRERDEGDPRLTRANVQAGLEFDPDNMSLGTVRTTDYHQRQSVGEEEEEEMEDAVLDKDNGLVRGLAGLKSARQNGQPAPAGGPTGSSAHNGGESIDGPPLSGDSSRHCGGDQK